MRVVFCHMGSESMGIEYLSAVLKSMEHEVFLVFDPALFNDKHYLHIGFLAKVFNVRNRLLDEIVELNPDVIGFTVLTDTYKWACSFANEIKEVLPETRIIFGGIHPTSVPEKVIENDFVDALCIGESEEAFLEFVESPERTDIQNFWFKINGRIIKNGIRPLNQDLDSLPFADKSIFSPHISIRDCYLITATRGCPFNCTYCSSSFLNSLYIGQKIVRRRSVKHVIDELRLAKKMYEIRSVYFMDDVFCTDIEYVREFFRVYRKQVQVPFKIISHPAAINEEMIKILKKSGCFNIEMGIQSMCPETRKNILKRYESDRVIEKAVEICERNKMPYTIHHLLGLPADDYSKLLKAAEFYHKLRYCKKIDCYWLSYFPRTEIVEISKELGIINDEIVEQIEEGEEPMYFEGGSIRSKSMKRLCKNFDIFFKIMPALPRFAKAFILKTRLFNFFYILPDSFIVFANLINAIKNRDRRTFDYIRHYIISIIKYSTSLRPKSFSTSS